MITVNINNQEYQFPNTSSLQNILEDLKISQNGIAVAINESVISNLEWSKTFLRNNDNVLIIKAVQGG